jgi:hypothetical protein
MGIVEICHSEELQATKNLVTCDLTRTEILRSAQNDTGSEYFGSLLVVRIHLNSVVFLLAGA